MGKVCFTGTNTVNFVLLAVGLVFEEFSHNQGSKAFRPTVGQLSNPHCFTTQGESVHANESPPSTHRVYDVFLWSTVDVSWC